MDSPTYAPTWIGARACVDDLVLVSKSPFELKSMLNICQSWCEKRRVEINIDKTKIMKFNTPQPRSELRPQYLVYQFKFLPPDHPNKTRQLKVVDSFKYFGIPIDNDLTMSTLATPHT